MSFEQSIKELCEKYNNKYKIELAPGVENVSAFEYIPKFKLGFWLDFSRRELRFEDWNDALKRFGLDINTQNESPSQIKKLSERTNKHTDWVIASQNIYNEFLKKLKAKCEDWLLNIKEIYKENRRLFLREMMELYSLVYEYIGEIENSKKGDKTRIVDMVLDVCMLLAEVSTKNGGESIEFEAREKLKRDLESSDNIISACKMKLQEKFMDVFGAGLDFYSSLESNMEIEELKLNKMLDMEKEQVGGNWNVYLEQDVKNKARWVAIYLNNKELIKENILNLIEERLKNVDEKGLKSEQYDYLKKEIERVLEDLKYLFDEKTYKSVCIALKKAIKGSRREGIKCCKEIFSLLNEEIDKVDMVSGKKIKVELRNESGSGATVLSKIKGFFDDVSCKIKKWWCSNKENNENDDIIENEGYVEFDLINKEKDGDVLRNEADEYYRDRKENFMKVIKSIEEGNNSNGEKSLEWMVDCPKVTQKNAADFIDAREHSLALVWLNKENINAKKVFFRHCLYAILCTYVKAINSGKKFSCEAKKSLMTEYQLYKEAMENANMTEVPFEFDWDKNELNESELKDSIKKWYSENIDKNGDLEINDFDGSIFMNSKKVKVIVDNRSEDGFQIDNEFEQSQLNDEVGNKMKKYTVNSFVMKRDEVVKLVKK